MTVGLMRYSKWTHFFSFTHEMTIRTVYFMGLRTSCGLRQWFKCTANVGLWFFIEEYKHFAHVSCWPEVSSFCQCEFIKKAIDRFSWHLIWHKARCWNLSIALWHCAVPGIICCPAATMVSKNPPCDLNTMAEVVVWACTRSPANQAGWLMG